MDKTKRLNMKGIRLTSESDWVEVVLSNKEIEEGIRLGTLQEEESKKLDLKIVHFQAMKMIVWPDRLLRSKQNMHVRYMVAALPE
jgi:hypothetical protein